MTVFDTETMAELCVRQGLYDQAVDIFRRLSELTDDATARLRFETRIAELTSTHAPGPAEVPGLRVTTRVDEVEVEWRLPPETPAPMLQVLLLRRGAGGIETDPRSVTLATTHGSTVFAVADLCGVRAAAGKLIDGGAFVPLVRFPDRIA